MTDDILDRFEDVLRDRLFLIRDLPPPEFEVPDQGTLDRLQAYSAVVGSYVPPAVDSEDLQIGGPHGDIDVRLYRPRQERAGGIVWVHGGAFAFGDLDFPEADVVSRELCARTGSTVVSVGYRLATGGVHYPVPHDDVHAAWLWAAGTDGPTSGKGGWLLGGASAGGNLALGAATRLRDEDAPMPVGLLLAYPVAHMVIPPADDGLRGLMRAIPAPLRFTDQHVAQMNSNYVGPIPPGPYAMPGDGLLAGLPPTLIVLSEFDDLRPSGERLAKDLLAAGVAVRTIIEPGTPHGHLNIPGLPSALRSLSAMAAFAHELVI